MWLFIGLSLKITKLRPFSVLPSYPKQVLDYPKQDLFFTVKGIVENNHITLFACFYFTDQPKNSSQFLQFIFPISRSSYLLNPIKRI